MSKIVDKISNFRDFGIVLESGFQVVFSRGTFLSHFFEKFHVKRVSA